MGTPYLGEVRIIAWNFPPKGWSFCNGQIMPINQNTALFSILGTTYGGNGIQTFALPNLQSRVPMHATSGIEHPLGQVGGEQIHDLNPSEMPAHTHLASCNKNAGDQPSAMGTVWAADGAGNLPYSTTGGAALQGGAITNAGGGLPHSNLAPYLVVNFIIALVGIFPSRS
jgi:microcystin-dependent protein